jgi:hypothetical protein
MNCIATLLCLCPSVSAQSVAGTSVPLARVFVGGGMTPATNDAGSRMRLIGEDSSFPWFIEGGAAISSSVGVGVEFVQPTAVTASTSGTSFHASGRQEEQELIGLLRGRAFSGARVALDVVGGAGVLFQRHEQRFAPCFSGCPDTLSERLNRKAPAFILGADIPVHLARHVAIAGTGRYHFLRRGDHVTELPVLIPWQYEWTSSSRLSIGISARALW